MFLIGSDKLKRPRVLGVILGVALLGFILSALDTTAVFQTVGGVGARFSWLILISGLPIFCAAFSWFVLFQSGSRPGFSVLLVATWVGLAVNWLLPVAQVGGEIVKGRLVRARYGALTTTWPTVVVDKLLQASTQALFGMVGLLLLVWFTGDKGFLKGLISIGILSSVVLLVAFGIRRFGVFALINRFVFSVWKAQRDRGKSVEAHELDHRVRQVLENRRSLLRAGLWRFGFRVAFVFEIYVASRLLGMPLTFMESLILEALAQTARMMAFAIPGGLGAQEGVLTLVGTALGLTPETALAMSLLKRGRELAVGLPALACWQWREVKQ